MVGGSVFSDRWVGGRPVGASMVGCRWSVGQWRTCRWVVCRWLVGRWLVVSGSVEDLSVGHWSVVGGLPVVGGFIIRPERKSDYYNKLAQKLINPSTSYKTYLSIINNASGHDNISIRTIRQCDEAIVKPLFIIFKNSIDTGIFLDLWKKSNIVPVHNKGDKQLLQNYRPVSLLPILEKILEKLYDSCEYQLLSIVHEIYTSFDCYPPLDIRAVFLDISKAFDRVWHEGLIYKIKRMDITGLLLQLTYKVF